MNRLAWIRVAWIQLLRARLPQIRTSGIRPPQMVGAVVRWPAWVPFALGSFLCYGATNFLLGAIFEWSGRDPATSFSAPLLLWLTMGACGAAAALALRASGRGFKGLPQRRFAWAAAAAGVTLAAAMLTLKLGLAADPESKGPIVAITSSNAVVVALGAWLVLRERLSWWQAMGMLVVLSGIAVVALAGGGTSSVRGVLFGLATMLLFGLTNLLLKWTGARGSDSVTVTVILWLAAGGCGLLAVGYSLLRYGSLPGLADPGLVLWSVFAGVTLALGMLFLKLAVTKGPGGPATAVAGSNSVLVAVLEWLVFSHVPPALKLTGMGIAIAGIVILGFASPLRPGADSGPRSSAL